MGNGTKYQILICAYSSWTNPKSTRITHPFGSQTNGIAYWSVKTQHKKEIIEDKRVLLFCLLLTPN